MPIVSGFVVPKMNPTSHDGNIRLLRPMVLTIKHQIDNQTHNDETNGKEKPDEILDIMTEIGAIIFLVPLLNSLAFIIEHLAHPKHGVMSFRIILKESQIYLSLSSHITTPPIRLITRVSNLMKIEYPNSEVHVGNCRAVSAKALSVLPLSTLLPLAGRPSTT